MQWKYNEEQILNELREYISKTYQQHYSAGDDRIQTLDTSGIGQPLSQELYFRN